MLIYRCEIIKWKTRNYKEIFKLSFLNEGATFSNGNVWLIQQPGLFILKNNGDHIETLSKDLTEKKKCLKVMINKNETLALIGIKIS